jgi:hypothetical protein
MIEVDDVGAGVGIPQARERSRHPMSLAASIQSWEDGSGRGTPHAETRPS